MSKLVEGSGRGRVTVNTGQRSSSSWIYALNAVETPLNRRDAFRLRSVHVVSRLVFLPHSERTNAYIWSCLMTLWKSGHACQMLDGGATRRPSREAVIPN